ncbi:MAG TPA: hypothetical protein VIJ07_12415, partial [Dermatophilaceae bacterium]
VGFSPIWLLWVASFAMDLVRECVFGGGGLGSGDVDSGALAAGAAKGVSETATTAVKEAYAGLKKLVAGRLAGRPTAEVALAEHEQDPENWKAPLGKALTETNAATDPQVIEAAEQLMALVDPAGSTVGKYTVDLRGAQGVQVGDHNEQTNTFGSPPAGQYGNRCCPLFDMLGMSGGQGASPAGPPGVPRLPGPGVPGPTTPPLARARAAVRGGGTTGSVSQSHTHRNPVSATRNGTKRGSITSGQGRRQRRGRGPREYLSNGGRQLLP